MEMPLAGRAVRLEQLSNAHTESLWAAIGTAERSALWTYIFTGPYLAKTDFAQFIETKSKAQDAKWFAVVPQATNSAGGILCLMREDKIHRVIEAGSIVLGPALQRSYGATEAQYLLAKYVFEKLGYRRYEWKCDNQNEPSKRAAERLGFAFEGVFRQHMIVKGKNRDTAWYSITDAEWPARKAAFLAWLSEDNFDAEGVQRRKLTQLRA